jgi:hypothetical protein
MAMVAADATHHSGAARATGRLIVTVEAPGRRTTVTVPGDLPAGELVPLLAEAVGDADADAVWTLAPRGGRALGREQTLRGAGLLDGSIVRLTPAGPDRPRAALAGDLRRLLRPAPLAAAGLLVLAGVGLAASLGAWFVVASQPRPAALSPALASRAFPAPVRGSLRQPVALSGVQLTVEGVTTGGRGAAPPAGYRLLTVDVRYRDTGGGTVIVSPYDWVLTDSAGHTYGPTSRAGELPQRELRAGGEVSGPIAFVVPDDSRGLVLTYHSELGFEAASVTLT